MCMNLLVYDESRSIPHFARSVLLRLGGRVSISEESEDARAKLDTGLFDGLIIGPSGVPHGLAHHLDFAWPELPIVLAGVERKIEPIGRIRAVLPRPLSASRLASAVARLRADAEAASECVAVVAAGGDRVECRAVRLSSSALLVEPPREGPPESFSRFFDRPAGSRVEAALRTSAAETHVDAEIAFAEWAPGRRARFIGLRISSPCTMRPSSPA